VGTLCLCSPLWQDSSYLPDIVKEGRDALFAGVAVRERVCMSDRGCCELQRAANATGLLTAAACMGENQT